MFSHDRFVLFIHYSLYWEMKKKYDYEHWSGHTVVQEYPALRLNELAGFFFKWLEPVQIG